MPLLLAWNKIGVSPVEAHKILVIFLHCTKDYTGDYEIFAIILFSRTAVKDIFVKVKNRD